MDKETLDSLPYLVIEELLPDIHVSGVFTGADNVPLAYSRIKYIKKVHAIRFSFRGCYLAKNLGTNPHYTVRKEDFDKVIRQRCGDFSLSLKVYSSERIMEVSDILTVFNFPEGDIEDPGSEMLRSLLDELRFADLHCGSPDNDSEKKVIEDKIRGPTQRHFGYGSNYSLTRLKEEDGGYVCPRIIGGEVPVQWKDRFRIMTKIAREIYHHEGGESIKGNPEYDIYGDKERNAMFANTIHEESDIDSLTHSQSKLPKGVLKLHRDKNNDETSTGVKRNYNLVVCAWEHHFDDIGEAVRDAILGFSRRSIPDFIRRSSSCKHYVEKVVRPWLDTLPEWRKAIVPDGNIFDESYFEGTAKLDDSGALVFPTSINKQATYLSAFADSFLQFKSAYERSHNKEMTVEKQLECILPVAFCNSARPYVRVFRKWRSKPTIMRECMENNITEKFVGYSNDHFTSFRHGGHPRHQPTFNEDPSSTWVLTALRTLLETVVKSVKVHYTYKCMTCNLKKIHKIGDLTAQHLVHVMALVGIIDPRYGLDATICMGTRTAKKLSAKYGIPKSSFPCMLEYVSRELKYTKNIAENVSCKSIQPEDSTFKDSIEADQQTIRWVEEHNGEARVRCMTRCNKKFQKADLPHMLKSISFHSPSSFESWNEYTTRNLDTNDIRVAINVWFVKFSSETLGNWMNDERCGRKKRKSQNSIGKPGFKRLKIGPNAFSICIPTVPKIDWTKLDKDDLKQYTRQYSRDVKSQAIFKSKDSCFGNDKFGHGPDLRLVHGMGKHIMPSNRECSLSGKKETNFKSHKSFFKNPTHMQSQGVKVACLDLYHVAADCGIRDYRTKYPSRTEKLQLIIVLHSTRTFGETGLPLFAAVANVCTMGKPRFILETIRMETKDRPVSIRSNQVKTHCNPNENSEIPQNALLYRTKASAKDDLLWFLASRNNHPQRWIVDKLPRQIWASITSGNESPCNASNNGVLENSGNIFLILTLQNGPANSRKGDTFCSMMYRGSSSSTIANFEKGCILASFHHGSTHHKVLTIVSHGIVLLDKPVCKKVFDDSEILTHANPMCSKATTTAHVSLSNNIASAKPDKGVLREPLEIDVFRSIDENTTPRSQFPGLLAHWSRFWSHSLSLWTSTFVIRPRTTIGDTYWYPPGASTKQRYIRSGADLRSYLDYAVRHAIVEEGISTLNHTNILTNWKRETDNIKKALPKCKRKRRKSK